MKLTKSLKITFYDLLVKQHRKQSDEWHQVKKETPNRLKRTKNKKMLNDTIWGDWL